CCRRSLVQVVSTPEKLFGGAFTGLVTGYWFDSGQIISSYRNSNDVEIAVIDPFSGDTATSYSILVD
ncbi:MAG: hypothetical protein Q8N15_02160, partial [Bacillota bacterium]|nr:hypothetical protein [Bacillota bacterium]